MPGKMAQQCWGRWPSSVGEDGPVADKFWGGVKEGKKGIFLQAHHDYCHAADISQAASDAFHEYVGICSECHVLRDRWPHHLPRAMALPAVAALTHP